MYVLSANKKTPLLSTKQRCSQLNQNQMKKISMSGPVHRLMP